MSHSDDIRFNNRLFKQRVTNTVGSTWLSFLVIFIGTAELYCGYMFIIPMYFTQYGKWAPFLMKIFTTFVYVQVLAHWFYVKYHHSFYHPEQDAPPDNQKSPWEDFETKPRSDPRFSKLRLRLDGNELADEESYQLSRETAQLSWKHCHICQIMSPPRSHHCKICNACVLKRDHHCFLTGTCIGFYNQRHFVILNFYLAIAMIGGCVYLYKYMADTMYDKLSVVDYFLPVMAVKCLLGDYEHQYFLMLCFCYTFWWVALLAIGFLCWQVWTISSGKTPFELRKKLSLRNTESIGERIKSVFGSYWLLNFLLPVVLFPQQGDGTSWGKFKIVYKYRTQDNSPDSSRSPKQYVIKMLNNHVVCDMEKQPDVYII